MRNKENSYEGIDRQWRIDDIATANAGGLTLRATMSQFAFRSFRSPFLDRGVPVGWQTVTSKHGSFLARPIWTGSVHTSCLRI